MTNGQREVLEVLDKYGPLPDLALVPLAQHLMHKSQTSSSIRSRRAELERMGYVQSVDEITTASNRKANVYKVVKR